MQHRTAEENKKNIRATSAATHLFVLNNIYKFWGTSFFIELVSKKQINSNVAFRSETNIKLYEKLHIEMGPLLW